MTGYRHGFARPKDRFPAYRSWEAAKSRCRNPNDPSFANYGGRGIEFSHEWDDFLDFLRDMGPRPPGTTLDRIDTNGNYEPGNCRWADASTQARNTGQNRHVEYQGQRVTMIVLAERTGVPYQRLHDRIVRRGWNVDRAITEPVRRW